jgi:hypothetical protein
VTGIVDGVTTIEDRLKQADQETFSGRRSPARPRRLRSRRLS